MKGRRAAWPTRRELVAVLAGGAGVFSVLLAAGLLFGPIGQLAALCVMAPIAVAVGIIIGSRLL